jgi:aminopeptidase-like protein
MKRLIESLLLKNRTIVSADAKECMRLISEQYSINVLAYPSGSEHQTWVIPPEWNVRKGHVSYKGRQIAGHDESPLFVARYSSPFKGRISKQELAAHAFTNPEIPNAYCYEFRLAYNFRRRLSEWRIAIPYERLRAIPDDAVVDVEVDVEVKDGALLIAESSHAGSSGYWFTLLSHYCHVAQANDGLAGVVIMLEAVKRIRQRHPKPKYGYKALAMPETIGSSIYVASNEAEVDATIGGVFSEMGGAREPLQLVASRRGDTYIDRIFRLALDRLGRWPVRQLPFRNGWGNDELVFDAPGVGVPIVSIDRYPFPAYHTHFDNMDLVDQASLEDVVKVIVAVADLLEADYIPRLKNRVPVYLSRYDLYADWTHQRQAYDNNIRLLDRMNGQLSVVDLALQLEINLDDVRSYIDKFAEFDLIEKLPVTPDYSRQVRFLPKKYEN